MATKKKKTRVKFDLVQTKVEELERRRTTLKGLAYPYLHGATAKTEYAEMIVAELEAVEDELKKRAKTKTELN